MMLFLTAVSDCSREGSSLFCFSLPYTHNLGKKKSFPGGSDSKASASNAGDSCSIPGLERSPGEGHGNPLQYSCLENSMDWGAWWATSPWGHKESDTTEWLHFALLCYTEKSGWKCGYYASSVATSSLCIMQKCLRPSIQFSHSVMSDSLRPHELQHARPPCPSPTPGVYPNPCPLSRWCHPTILSSVIAFSSCPQSFPASGSFQMSQLFTSGGQSIGVSASTSVFPMNTQDWYPLGWTGWISLQSEGLSRVFSNTTVQKHQFFSAQLLSEYLGYSTWPLHTSSCQSFVLLPIVCILMNVFFEKVPLLPVPPPPGYATSSWRNKSQDSLHAL